MRRRSAFSLFQLLTVLAILAFGFALFMPALARARAMAGMNRANAKARMPRTVSN